MHKKLFSSLIVILITICLIYFCLEQYSKYWCHNRIPKIVQSVIIYDTYTGWKNKEYKIFLPDGSFTLDRNVCKEKEYILCLGDSGTYGINKEIQDSVSYCAELSVFMKMPVYNAGVCGYTTLNICRQLQTLHLPTPKFVCVRSLVNDLRWKNWFANRPRVITDWDDFYTYQFLCAIGKRTFPAIGPQEYYENLQYITRFYVNVPTFIIEYPFKNIDFGDQTDITNIIGDSYTRVAQQVQWPILWKNNIINGVIFVYVQGYFNDTDLVHPTAIGAHVIAQEVSTAMEKIK